MYEFLTSHLPIPIADAVMALWYALLIVLIFYAAFEPQAEFNYLFL